MKDVCDENGRPQKDFIFPSLLRFANTLSGKYKVFPGAVFWNSLTLVSGLFCFRAVTWL